MRKAVYIAFAAALFGSFMPAAMAAKRTAIATPRPTPTPTPTTKAAVTVEWTKVANATGYRLFYGRTSRTYPNVIRTSGTVYRVTGLSHGVRYYFAVKAVTAAGPSVYSAEKTWTPQ